MKIIIKIFSIFLFNIVSATKIADGVIYKNIKKENPTLSIHLVKIDPSKVSIIIESAHSKCKSSEQVTQMAMRKNAIVAINAGFFDFGQKNKMRDLFVKFMDTVGYNKSNTFPVLGLKINNQWFSITDRIAGTLAWDKEKQIPVFGTTNIEWQLQIENRTYPIAELNKPYAHGPILYNPSYDTHTPIKDRVIEIVIQNGKIIDIIKRHGGTEIPKDGLVYAIEPRFLNKINITNFALGQEAKIIRSFSNDSINWEDKDYIIGSTPLLISNGEIIETVINSISPFFVKKHPRTAVGLLKDNHWLFVVVDGRQSHSEGISLLDLAKLMKKLGCTYALNFDGGGSSIMVIENNIVNIPSGREFSLSKKERSVSNAIIVLPKQ